ncbi:hypothetical protein POM88_047563 [Heracleum sosnowskyi]|uniref:Uncharacterized protein n=1 Tax=Heracleum sosnowskyi TaxID=360622 RepID=A0AAD8GSF4_9APIA|nr:hypothetical protein POM88_047563 [Heracleum sosnowskyi]
MPALPVLAKLVISNDEQALTDACWALSYLAHGTNDKIQAVIDSGVCGRLVELLDHPSSSNLFPALRTVGIIVTGDDMQTQALALCIASKKLCFYFHLCFYPFDFNQGFGTGNYHASCFVEVDPTSHELACCLSCRVLTHECYGLGNQYVVWRSEFVL